MEHPCHKCNAPVEDGVAYCRHCGAPQIRVVVETAPALPSVAEPVFSSSVTELAAVQSTTRWKDALRATLFAALISTGLVCLGLHFLVAAITNGFLAVLLYHRRVPLVSMQSRGAAGLGSFGGFLFSVLVSMAGVLAVVLLHKGPELKTQMLDAFVQAASRYPAGQAQPLIELVNSSAGFAFLVTMAGILGLIVSVALSALGGVLARAFLCRRHS